MPRKQVAKMRWGPSAPTTGCLQGTVSWKPERIEHRRLGCNQPVFDHVVEVARTIARMPARTAVGRSGHAATTAERSAVDAAFGARSGSELLALSLGATTSHL